MFLSTFRRLVWDLYPSGTWEIGDSQMLGTTALDRLNLAKVDLMV